MAVPNVIITVQDFGLGVTPATGEGVQVKLGTCTLGTPNTIYSITSRRAIQDNLGFGPLAEACAVALGEGSPLILAVPTDPTVVGTTTPGAITQTGSGTCVPSGAAVDNYEGQVKITAEGELGGGKFQYSLDGGNTFTPDILIPLSGTYIIPDSGVTLTFANGVPTPSFEVGDTFLFSTTAPGYTVSDLNDALDVVIANTTLNYRFIHVVGESTPTVAAAVKTRLQELEDTFRYKRAYLDAIDDTDANLIASWSAFESTRVTVSAGFAEVVSPLTGLSQKRPAGWLVAGRRGRAASEEDLGFVAAGALNTPTRLYRDEFVTPGLDDARFTTLLTRPGLSGQYITQGKTRAPIGSDFELDQYGLIMDVASETAYLAGLRYLNAPVRVNTSTGRIDARDGLKIEADITAQLQGVLRDRISSIDGGNEPAVFVAVDRTNNVLSTRELIIDIAIIPLGYNKQISITLRFANPAVGG